MLLWLPILVFVLVMLVVVGAYFMIGPMRAQKAEVRKRLSLLELRSYATLDLPNVLKEELYSDVPFFQRLLSRVDIAVRIDKRLKQAGLETRVGTFVLVSVVLFAIGALIGFVLHWPRLLGFLLGVLLSLIPTVVVGIKRNLRFSRFLRNFPEALEMFARSLRAGHSFTGAIQLVAQEMPKPIGPEFQKVFDEQNLGIPLKQALVGMADRIDLLDLKFFVTAILIQRETGGNLAEIIDKISYVIRERFRVQGQLKIFTAQARLTGVILALLPISIAFLLWILNPGYMKPLFYESAGRWMLVIAAVMQIAGMLVIRRIIRIKI